MQRCCVRKTDTINDRHEFTEVFEIADTGKDFVVYSKLHSKGE